MRVFAALRGGTLLRIFETEPDAQAYADKTNKLFKRAARVTVMPVTVTPDSSRVLVVSDVA